ncbi:Chitinase [Sodalis praecaptivus]|uniref:Chitinase n=1 Tax=Sodalis praecaptivus TaxID=1239307 RepID=W0HXU0_9GAMM|nr:chitinase [Sodalis praecaptivus]AHF77015.1 Chitinase [Sodalis praecaptivus]
MKTLITPYIDVTINALWSDWQNYPQGRPNPLYSQEAIDWNVDGLILAFITLSPSKKPCWAAQDAMPLDWALPLANDLYSAGRKVIVSFGGASNNDISMALSVEELIATYQETIDRYHASGLDFDLENGLYNIKSICEALKVIQQRNPDISLSFTLPTLPSGLTGTGLNIVQQAIAANLRFVINGMAMDYYDPNYKDHMGRAATEAATSINNQLASLGVKGGYQCVAVTPMIGLNDDLSIFTLDDANTVAAFAKMNDVAFIGMWDFNRDNPSSYGYVDLTTSSNPEQTHSGQYSMCLVSHARS